jgi:hypothetical protein
MTAEHQRLREAREGGIPWRKWGPYLSERQWGTVREDSSSSGDAWGSFTHDQARSRTYRWGEDGIAGLCDEQMQTCIAFAFWNGHDRILKERMFGLANGEGNHGEDVKEYYFYLDNLPTHAYMRMLYKYPQREFPYSDLVHQNRERSRLDLEYELIDTHVFDEDRYFDIVVEYAKASPEDILIRMTALNRGPEAAVLHVLPHIWFRNTWWRHAQARPSLERAKENAGAPTIVGQHPDLGRLYLQCEAAQHLLFTNNETNTERLYDRPNPTPFVKDGIAEYVVNGRHEAVDPMERGTKAAAYYRLQVGRGGTSTIRLRLSRDLAEGASSAFVSFDSVMTQRRAEADEFYAAITPSTVSPDDRNILRQALAGLLWSKQAYLYDLSDWLNQHGAPSPSSSSAPVRNHEWSHMVASDVISMPDKWEYPWFASWDLAFQSIALTFVDPDFAQMQLDLLLRERYTHPNGQIPAYEWNFGDVNPPVHAWATLFNYRLLSQRQPERALEMLRNGFNKLLLNFTWWVNRKDRSGRTVFEGGFLGLDNIGVFDRNAPLPAGGYLEEADGTAWMALYSQNMLEMALELALRDPAYEQLALKFYEHFIWIAAAMDRVGDFSDEMWDEKDGFFYDVMRFPNGSGVRLKVRSLVGLLPLCAVTVFPEAVLTKLPRFVERVQWFNRERSDLLRNINQPGQPGVDGRRMLSILDERKLRRMLARLLDPEEFLSEHGIRALSRHHRDHPYVFRIGQDDYQVAYRPAESDSGMFGGNSNWRGPVWFPVNILMIRALLQFYSYYGDSFRVECPTGSGQTMTLFQVATFLARRLVSIFERNREGHRPVYGGTARFQNDPYWRDLILFYEYFHGDNGAGLGASHQTGWTALVAAAIYLGCDLTAEGAQRDLAIVFQRLAERSA